MHRHGIDECPGGSSSRGLQILPFHLVLSDAGTGWHIGSDRLCVVLTLFCNSDGEHSPKVCPQAKYCEELLNSSKRKPQLEIIRTLGVLS